MPTIKQLPAATAVAGADLLPISQSGLTRSVAVSTLLSGVQPTLSLAQGSLLGRVSAGLGGAEAVGIGTGLALQGGAVVANGSDHLSLPLSTALQSGDEVVVNSSATPKRLLATALRSLFSAGTGVAIDGNGVISSTVVSSGNGTTVQGPKGDTGATGPAGQGFTFRGSWLPNQAYAVYDVVVYAGQSYVVTIAFTSAATFDSSNLSLLAAQGAAGPTGAQGATGAQGPAGVQGPAGPTLAATLTSLGAVKPGAGLSVSSDGTLTLASVNLSLLGQSGASTGQLLGWTGTAWAPTAASAGGVSTFNSRSGSVSLTLSDVIGVLGTGAGARTTLGLATVASTGAYTDLTGTPFLPAAGTTAPLMNGTASAGVATAFARADHIHPSDTSRLSAANNLSDVTNTTTARTNLGLGTAAVANVGTAAGTVAAGNDARIVGALQATAIPTASGQLLGGSGTAGVAATITVGSGLTLSGGTLSATGGGGTGAYTLPAASTSTLGGVKPDGTTVTTASDGTLTVAGVSLTGLTDISTLGGPALSDIDVLNRGGSDYKTTISARVSLYRRTPAGSRTITLASGSTTATLTASDHDKTVVVTGVAGTLAVDGTISDGFRCEVINHTASALSFSGINGLGATTLATNAACWVSLANSTVEAAVSAGGYSLPAATTSALGGIKPDGSTVTTSSDGTLSVVATATTALTDVATLGGPVLTDIDVLNRGGTDYRTTLSARATLFRKTPAGSRAVTLASGSTTATLTAADHDKTVVVSGVAGTLAVDNTITDGFRCQVINHTGSALTYSAIAGLQGTTSLPNNTGCLVSLANGTIEAALVGSVGATAAGTNGQLQLNNNGAFAGVTLTGDGTLNTSTGALTVTKTNGAAFGGAATLNVGTTAGTVAAGNDSRLVASTTAYLSAGVSGTVASLPGGAGAVIYRYALVRPCSLATNLAAPYPPQMQAGTLPSATASFGLVRRQSNGTQTSLGTISITSSGTVSATVTTTSLVAGDVLLVTAPSPADTTLADVSLTFTGTWS